MKAAFLNAAVYVALAGVSLPASAYSSTTRTGINFGASVRALNTSQQAQPGQGSDNNTAVNTNGNEISAYVGYAWTSLSLGLAYTNETASTHSTQISTDGQSKIDQLTETKGSGEDLFVRYLFGKYFYFQAGVGLYQQTLNVSNETRLNSSGSAFTGTLDAHTYNGSGPSYHGGGGIELPITGGFCFTTAYTVRIVELFSNVTGTSIGQKASTLQKSELLFGLAYYDHKSLRAPG